MQEATTDDLRLCSIKIIIITSLRTFLFQVTLQDFKFIFFRIRQAVVQLENFRCSVVVANSKKVSLARVEANTEGSLFSQDSLRRN